MIESMATATHGWWFRNRLADPCDAHGVLVATPEAIHRSRVSAKPAHENVDRLLLITKTKLLDI
ncbi:hypothetical protein [Planotetraspora phitsanulokensis]|uniref:hypothetical protein n=1 Tax=Planotetraspora phitsanulokensis TaxID=575192 RepID=UPI0019515A39|nr:hypothetical protein [Planotetraspora phitsanulokensis]